ncbi:MAG TPA: hypothetical protein VGM90_21745 [Kofleriaceae bacterium]
MRLFLASLLLAGCAHHQQPAPAPAQPATANQTTPAPGPPGPPIGTTPAPTTNTDPTAHPPCCKQ